MPKFIIFVAAETVKTANARGECACEEGHCLDTERVKRRNQLTPPYSLSYTSHT